MMHQSHGRRGFFGAFVSACVTFAGVFLGWEWVLEPRDGQIELEPYPDAPMERIKMHREDMRHNAEAARAALERGDLAQVERLARDQELLAIEALHAITDRERETGETPPMDGEIADALAAWCSQDLGWIDRYIEEHGETPEAS